MQDSTNKRGRAWPGPPSLLLARDLLDRDLLALRRGLLGQREFQHAVLELGFGFGLVELLRQREAAHDLAVDALVMEHALVLRRFLFALDLGFEGHLRAVDVDVDVFLLYSGKLGGDQIVAVLLRHIDLGPRQYRALAPPFEAERPHEETLEQIIDSLTEGITA